MPKILRLPEGTAPGSVAEADLPLVPQAEFLRDPASRIAGGRKVGVRVAPADKVEDLAAHLGELALIAIEFPSPGEGRGYTYARLLRQRYAFTGEIRAVGPAVKQDLLFFMLRCGINAFDLVATENADEARAALQRFTLAYQPAVPNTAVREARFTAVRR